jgi:hypothetical protein
MTRWEYRVVRPDAHKNDIFHEINTAGKDGWELVGLVGQFIYMKRPIK